MDQATFARLLSDGQTSLRTAGGLADLTIAAGRFDAPVVVLIHGIGGTAQHWTDPVGIDINETWLFDLAAPPPPGTTGLGMSPPYPAGSVTPWVRLLGGRGMTTVVWSQARPNDLLQYATAEAATVLSALETHVFAPYARDVAANGGALPPLVLLCHSRGGLVARAALKALGAAGAPHLQTVITLSTPHTGSYMPRLADDYNSGLMQQIDFHGLTAFLPGLLALEVQALLGQVADRVRQGLLHRFGSLAVGPGYDELLPGSAALTALAQDEAPLPGVSYHSFGGSDPSFIRFYLCAAGQQVALPDISRYLVSQLSRLPDVAARYGGLAELDRGDSSVALVSSPWPAAFGAANQHQVVRYNHMQALVDPTLQAAVLALLQA
jgi:pimeloyl-ACP methyl ester carboxylesterase